MSFKATDRNNYCGIIEWAKIVNDYCDQGKMIVEPKNLPGEVQMLFCKAVEQAIMEITSLNEDKRPGLKKIVIEIYPNVKNNFDYYFKALFKNTNINPKGVNDDNRSNERSSL